MSAPEPMHYIENKTYAEIAVGDHAELTRTLHPQDIELFAVMSGDVNPAHVDADYARTDMFHGIIAHGMWGGALISAVLGTELPGPGTIFLNQSLKFDAPVGLGDTITVRVEVTEKQEKDRLLLACTCVNQHGRMVIEGQAQVIAPHDKVRRPPRRAASGASACARRAIRKADCCDRSLGACAHRRCSPLRRGFADSGAGCGNPRHDRAGAGRASRPDHGGGQGCRPQSGRS